MNRKRKIAAALTVAFVMLFAAICPSEAGVPVNLTAEAEESKKGTVKDGVQESVLHAKAAVLMDADTGRVLYGKGADEVLPMASTTKIMTCITALEQGGLEETVTASAYAAAQPKVHLGMQKGRQYRLGDLLYSLMLESHNDSAVAIAEHLGGKMLSLPPEEERSREESGKAVAAFLKTMNEKAAAIGCENTCFLTPNGLDGEIRDAGGQQKIHATTAKELALMMRYCIEQSPKRKEFLEITRTPSYSFADIAGERSYACSNHNAFLHMMEGALSGKTGFTSKAGYCYVGALERDGKCFTVALLACGWPNHKTWKWADAKALINYGLEQYAYQPFDTQSWRQEALKSIPVERGQTAFLGETATVDVKVEEKAGGEEALSGMLLRADEAVDVRWQVEKGLTAPVLAGERVGVVEYVMEGQVYRTDTIVTVQEIKAVDYSWCLQKIWERFRPAGLAVH